MPGDVGHIGGPVVAVGHSIYQVAAYVAAGYGGSVNFKAADRELHGGHEGLVQLARQLHLGVRQKEALSFARGEHQETCIRGYQSYEAASTQ